MNLEDNLKIHFIYFNKTAEPKQRQYFPVFQYASNLLRNFSKRFSNFDKALFFQRTFVVTITSIENDEFAKAVLSISLPLHYSAQQNIFSFQLF